MDEINLDLLSGKVVQSIYESDFSVIVEFDDGTLLHIKAYSDGTLGTEVKDGAK